MNKYVLGVTVSLLFGVTYWPMNAWGPEDVSVAVLMRISSLALLGVMLLLFHRMLVVDFAFDRAKVPFALFFALSAIPILLSISISLASLVTPRPFGIFGYPLFAILLLATFASGIAAFFSAATVSRVGNIALSVRWPIVISFVAAGVSKVPLPGSLIIGGLAFTAIGILIGLVALRQYRLAV